MSRPSGVITYIIGGGLTGISAALHLETPYTLVEREAALGGLARTSERDGFFFDRTGHWLHLRDAGIRRLVTDAMGDQLVAVNRRAQIYSHGVLTRYPFQGNLYGLPPAIVYECLMGFIEARTGAGGPEPRNFEQYIRYHFGEGIARHFMVPYNSKLWGVHPREITSAWCERFVPRPTMEQVVAGAVGARPAELGYNVSFLYPKQGGIQALTTALVERIAPERVQLECELEEVDPANRTVTFGGARRPYKAIISSIPLPRLVERCVGAPPVVREAAARLRATAVQYLNVASRSRAPADYHWVYVPEERLPFYRVGVYSSAVPSMAPPGCSSLYVELASREPVADQQALEREVLPALVEVGALRAVEDVAFVELRRIDPAYVIFDDDYESVLQVILPYLEEHQIFSRGRYGSWIYNAMEDSLLAGRDAAARVDALARSEQTPLPEDSRTGC